MNVFSEGTGRIDVGELRNVLGNLGERLTYEESAFCFLSRMIRIAPTVLTRSACLGSR